MNRQEFYPCRNPQCDEGMVRTQNGMSDSWVICPECNGTEGDWRDVDPYDEDQS